MILAAVSSAPIDVPNVQWSALSPELVLIGGATLLLLLSLLVGGRLVRNLALLVGLGSFAGSAVAAGVIWDYGGGSWSVMSGELRVDRFGNAIAVVVCAAGILMLLTAVGWGAMQTRALELVALILIAGAGMEFLAVASSFVSLFVALELFSITLYALCAIDQTSRFSLESGLKYLILGSVGSAVLLYGAAFLYGSTGSLAFDGIRASFAEGGADDKLALIGTALVVAGLGFKIAAVPFHMWTPDVYEGAPTPITAFMAAATKAVAFVALARVLVSAIPAQSDTWEPALAALAIASMVAGNVLALAQTNVKRILAYSSIGHAGYLLIAIVSGGELGGKALLFYLGVYTAMTVGAFAVVVVREREVGGPVGLAELRGWGFSRPLLGGAMVVFLMSLGGLPPTGGFLAKLYLFGAAVDTDHAYLAIVGAVTTVISLGYYLRIGMALYDRAGRSTAAIAPVPGLGAATLCAVVAVAVVLWTGVYPADAIDWAGDAARTLVAAR